MGLSACLIVRNEERFLKDCLVSLYPWVDEICVVDTGSTDSTIEIAQGQGARIGHFAWCDDFSAARNASLDMASESWILVIDADETLTQASGEVLKQALGTPHALAWLIYQDNVDAQGQIHPLAVPRLFQNRPDIRFQRPVHESIMGSLFKIGVTDLPIADVHLLHRGYLPDVLSETDKLKRNLDILKKRAKAAPDDLFNIYKMAATLRDAGDLGQAEQAFERAFNLAEALSPTQRGEYPVAPLIYAAHAENLMTRGGLQQSGAVLARGMEAFPNDPDLHFQQGCLARRLGDSDTANEHLNVSIKYQQSRPLHLGYRVQNSIVPLIEMVKVAMDQGDAGNAQLLIDRCLKADPNDIATRCQWVRLLFGTRDLPKATYIFDELISQAPSSPEVCLLAGEIAWVNGDAAAAREMWRTITSASKPRRGRDRDAYSMCVAWQVISDLSADLFDEAALGAASLSAGDLQTASCALLALVAVNAGVSIDPAFQVGRLLAYAASWGGEVIAKGGSQAISRFIANATAYSARFPGIESLFSEIPDPMPPRIGAL